MRYGTAHYHCSTVEKNKTGTLGQGSNWRERGEEGGGRLEEESGSVWRETRKKAEGENEQGTGSLVGATGGPWKRQAFLGEGRRLKIQQSVAHCLALYVFQYSSFPGGLQGDGGKEGGRLGG